MFCTNCGSQMPEGQKFCTNCGATLQSTGSPSQPSQARTSSTSKKTPASTQIVETKTQKAATPQPVARTYNDSANPNTSQKPHKRDKKIIAVVTLVLILVVGGVGAATYFTNGFGLLSKENKPEQTNSNTSDSIDSFSSESKKTDRKTNADEKPTVKVSDVSFDTVKVARTYKENPSDIHAIKGTIENTTDTYVEATPLFSSK